MAKKERLMNGPRRRAWRGLILSVLLALLTLLPYRAAAAAPTSSRAEKNHDTVFIVDVSSSMRDIFDDVKAGILDYVRDARPGDNVALISFGKGASLRIRQEISSKKDIRTIERELAGLEPTEYYTNISGAVERGMEELRLLERKYPDHARTIVLVSDGKNNPPDDADSLTFEEILAKYPDLTWEGKSGFFYLSLGDDPDPEVMAFIEKVEGMSFDLGGDAVDLTGAGQALAFAQVYVEPVAIDLGTLLGPVDEVSVSLAFFPARGNPSGKSVRVSVSAKFKKLASRKTIVEVKPHAVICSGKPWTENLTFAVDSAEEGTIQGTLVLEPVEGQVLFIEPSEIPITMTIRQPHFEVNVVDRLDFGPIDPRFKYKKTQSVILIPNPAARGEPLHASCDIVIPDGMSVTTEIEKGDGIHELIVTVETDDSFETDHSMTLEGAVNLSGAERSMSFSKAGIEMTIRVAPPGFEGGSLAKTVSSLLSRYGKPIMRGVIGILVLAVMGYAAYYWFALRPQSALEGKLVLVHLKGRTRGKTKAVSINLHNVGRSIGRDTVVLGSAKEATITLPHKSVSAHHVEIYADMDQGNKRIYAEPVGKNFIIINMQKITKSTPLSDKDLVEIGAYTFRFEHPQPYKQIVVRYLDGKIEKGTPTTWDIDSDGFGLSPRDALPGSTEEIFISFCDLKAVYFVRDFDGQIGKKLVSPETQLHGIRMRLTFHDGEVIVGSTAQTYNPHGARFYFFPADQSGNTISMVVEREHLRKLEILDPTTA